MDIQDYQIVSSLFFLTTTAGFLYAMWRDYVLTTQIEDLKARLNSSDVQPFWKEAHDE